jgi:hypothetical protein
VNVVAIDFLGLVGYQAYLHISLGDAHKQYILGACLNVDSHEETEETSYSNRHRKMHTMHRAHLRRRLPPSRF